MKKNANRRFDSAVVKKTLKTTTLRLESLESRELLSVAPGGELFAPSVRAAYESNAATTDVDVLDLSAAMLDAANPEYAPTEGATTIVVTSAADDWDADDGLVTLREALEYANPGDTITFSNYLRNEIIELEPAQLTASKSVTIDASNLWDSQYQTPGITISGQDATRILKLDKGVDVEIIGITFMSGYANGDARDDQRGGAIYNTGATLSLENCVISGSFANVEGGGVYTSSGKTTLVNCDVSSNFAEYGAGIYSYDSDTTLANCDISYNRAYDYGGGIYTSSGKTTLTDCALSYNEAEKYGGGIYTSNGKTTLTDCAVSGNFAKYGAGIYSSYVDSVGPTFINCVVTNNSAEERGGGIYVYRAANLYNCTIADNTANDGGGVYLNGGGWMEASATLNAYNTIVVGNSATDADGGDDLRLGRYDSKVAVANAYNTLSSFNNWTTGANNLTYNASKSLFTNAAALDYTLANNSQAINKGSNQYVKTFGDLEGNVRVFNVTVDLGAYESQYAPGSVVSETLTKPAGLRETEKTGAAFSVAWDAVSNASGYKIAWRNKNESANSYVTLPASTTSYTFGGLEYGASYYWKVQALGDGVYYADSAYASARSVATNTSLTVTTENDVYDHSDGLISLREALDYANPGDTITFANSLRGKTIALELGQLTPNKSVTIDASNLWDATIAAPGLTISGSNSSRILELNKGVDVEINGITIANGSTYSEGGAIYNDASTLTLNNCAIRDNEANAGGAVYAYNGVTSFVNCTIANNSSYEGGGVYTEGGETTFVRCALTNNRADGDNGANGGAVYNNGGTLSLDNCMVSDNNAYDSGGGVFSWSGEITLDSCTVTSNIGSDTGGVSLNGAAVFNAYNSMIVGNSRRSWGEEDYVYEPGDVSLDCGNYNYDVDDDFDDPSIANAYSALSSFTEWTDGANNLTYDASQPLFTNVSEGDYTLAPYSQAINKGNEQYVTSDVDLAGNPRVYGETVDLGAYEFQLDQEAFSTVVTTELDVVNAYDGLISLREALEYAGFGDTITFADWLQGKTIALDSELGQLTVLQSVTIDASNLWDAENQTPGMTISGQGETRIMWTDGDSGSEVEINGITLTNGYGDEGGAIYNNYATLSLNNCAISGNEGYTGGGVYSYHGEITLVGCILSNNTSYEGDGGAIDAYDATLSLENCAIYNNYSNNGGGGISSQGGETTLVNCTVTNNAARERGGGVYLFSTGVLNAYNTIIAENSVEWDWDEVGINDVSLFRYDDSDDAAANAYNTLSSFTDWESGANNLTYDASQPLFTNASTNDFTLASNSQALDKGDNQYVTTSVDRAGSVRIAGWTVDLGAYELPQVVQLATPTATVTAKSATSITASWDAVPGASGYKFIWKDQTAASYTYVTLDASKTSYKFSGLDADASYVWKVLAFGDGVFYLDSAYCATHRDKPQQTLPAPTMTVVSAPASLTLNWSAVPGAERYTVSYKLASEADWHNVNAGASLSYTINNLQPNTQYELRLRSIGDGLNYKASDYSAVVAAKTDPAPDPIKLDAPTSPRATAKTATTITAAWDAVPNASGYRFIWKNQSDSSYTTVTLDASKTSYKITGLDASATYIWKVLATGDGLFYLNSDYCATQRVKPRQTLSTPNATATAATTFVALNWSAVPNAASYGVSYKLASASTWSDDLDAGTNLTYTITGLAQNAQYDVRVRAIGDGVDYGTSDYSSSVRVQTREPETLAVPNASASAKTATTITASWDAVPNASGYQFIWKNQSDASYTYVTLDATKTSYKMTGLDNAATYIWKVQALGDNVSYLKSAYCSTHRDKPQQSLATPTLTAAAATTSATLSWNAVPNAAGYRVSYKLATASTWSSDLDAGTDLSFTITGLKQHAQYDVRVKAVGDGIDYGTSDYSTTVQVQTREPETLAVPNASASAKTATTITASWDAVPNASGYQFIWKNQSDASYTYVTLGATKTSYKMSGLDVDATYIWKVQALGDNVSYLKSAYCSTQRDKPQQTLATPTVTATAATTSATLSWDAVPNAERYGISYRPSTSSTWSSDLDAGTNLSYTLTGLARNTLYYVRVRAIGDGVDYKTSAYSTTLRVKTVEPVQLAVPTPSVTAKTETTITAAWDAVPNASGYQFIWKNQSDASYTYVTLGATATSYKMTGLDVNSTYIWKVQALGDNVSYLKSAYCETQRDKPRQTLSAPTATAGDAAVTFLTVEWNAVPNAERYGVSYRPSTTSTWSSDVDAGTNLSYTLTGLEKNTLYYVRVRAIGDGVDYKTSAYSATVRAKTNAEPVQLATPSVTVGAASDLVAITWDAVPDAARYGVSYKRSDATAWTNVNVGKNLRYTITDLDTDVQYEVRVKAVGDETNFKSATSPIARATTSSAQVLSSSEYDELRQRYDKLTLPESLSDVNIVVPVDWTAGAIVNAIEIARATSRDDVVLLDPEKYADAVLDLSNVSITLDVDYETSGAITILSKGMDRAQVKANASAVTFDAIAGRTQFGGFDFVDANPDVPAYQATVAPAMGTDPTELVMQRVVEYTPAGTSIGDPTKAFKRSEPTVSATPSANDYALLFVGGGNAYSNMDEFYATLRDYYFELVEEFSLDPTKIYILYADGDVAGTSLNLYYGGELVTSDMSFATNTGATVRAATGATLTSTLGEIANLMTADSHLFFYTEDHGYGVSPVDEEGIVHPNATTDRYDYLIGWDSEGITGATVRDALFQIRQGYVTCVFTQCYSGGILDDIFDPTTGTISTSYTGSAHFAGGAAANHYETSKFREERGGYVGYPQTFEKALRQCRNSTGVDAFIYTEQNEPFSAILKKRETYAPNQGVFYGYYVGVEHPWHAGESFPVFASTQPSPPAITSHAETQNSISITWDAIQGATSYALEYVVAGSADAIIVDNLTTTSYKVTGLTPATNYAFRVRANNTVYSVPTSLWTNSNVQETPSTVVTTELDVVNAYDGLISLREALTRYSSAGDTITFASSLRGKTIELDPDRGQFYINKSITIDASNLAGGNTQIDGLTISGRDESRIMYISQADPYEENVQEVVVEINGITFANGYSDQGGAIYKRNATLTLNNCEIRDNESSRIGGGLYSNGGETTLVNCDVMNNTVGMDNEGYGGQGGGIYNYAATLSLDNCAISGNEAETYGGAVVSYYGETTLENCLVMNNTAGVCGGGVYSYHDQTTLTRCEVMYNAATESNGGGVYSMNDATLSLNDCSISNNRANSNGGGVFSITGMTTLSNCAITHNTAEYGGGVCAEADETAFIDCLVAKNYADYGGGLDLFGRVTLSNSTVTANTAEYGGGVNWGYEIDFTAYNSIIVGNIAVYSGVEYVCDESFLHPLYSDSFIFPDASVVKRAYNTLSKEISWESGANNITYDASKPLFTNAAAEDYALAVNSQAINKGSNQYVTTSVDLAGNRRVSGLTVDIGAYEFQFETPSAVVTTELDVVDMNDGLISLREALDYVEPGETITFADSLRGKTIALELGELCVHDVSETRKIDASSLWNAELQKPGITISGQNASRILLVEQAVRVEIDGIAFVDGDVNGNGGAILNWGDSLSLNNCAIYNCYASYGGAVSSGGGETTLVNCAINYNWAYEGGATYSSGGVTTFVNCVIDDNTAYHGGGIYASGGETTLVNCALSNNANSDNGGYGGAILNDGATLSLENCVVCDNTTYAGGAAVYADGGETTLTNCTVANNTASEGPGGGVNLLGASVFNAYNSMIVNNRAYDYSDETDWEYVENWRDNDVFLGAAALAKARNTLSSFTRWTSGANNLTYNASKPLFTNAAAGDYTLAANSQAIGKGNNQYVTTSVDLAGNPRVSDGTVDLGAYEYQATVGPIQLASPSVTVDAAMTSLTVGWNAVPHALRYSVSYKLASATTWTNVNVGTNTSYTISGLTSNTEYDVRVKAIGDGTNYASVYSSLVHVKTTADIVTLASPVLSVSGKTGTTMTLSWTSVANAERYSVAYKLASASTWTNVNVGTNTGYTITGLARNTEYDVRIKAIGDGVNYKSSYSSTVRAKTTTASSALLDLGDEFFDEFDEIADEDYDLLAENFIA